jgi:hypothetical protein
MRYFLAVSVLVSSIASAWSQPAEKPLERPVTYGPDGYWYSGRVRGGEGGEFSLFLLSRTMKLGFGLIQQEGQIREVIYDSPPKVREFSFRATCWSSRDANYRRPAVTYSTTDHVEIDPERTDVSFAERPDYDLWNLVCRPIYDAIAK